MLRIRLTRVGKRKQPAYRMVVADSRSPRDGSFLKIIGHYDPLTDPATLVVKEDEAIHWLEKGAKPSETAAKLLTRIGVMERAGRLPVRYQGKAVPPAPKKEAKASEPAPKAAPAQAPAQPKAEADVAEPESAGSVAGEAKKQPTVADAPAEPEAEQPTAEIEESPEAGVEPEAKEEAETPSNATNDEQSQE